MEQQQQYIGDKVLEKLRAQYPEKMRNIDFILYQAGFIDPEGRAMAGHFDDIRSVVVKYIPQTVTLFDDK